MTGPNLTGKFEDDGSLVLTVLPACARYPAVIALAAKLNAASACPPTPEEAFLEEPTDLEPTEVFSPDGIMMSGGAHCPKGYTKDRPLVIAGKHFWGGQFIPGKTLAKAPPAVKKEVAEHKKANPLPKDHKPGLDEFADNEGWEPNPFAFTRNGKTIEAGEGWTKKERGKRLHFTQEQLQTLYEAKHGHEQAGLFEEPEVTEEPKKKRAKEKPSPANIDEELQKLHSPEGPEAITESLNEAQKATDEHQAKYKALADGLPDGTVIKRGQRIFTKETVGGDPFWHYTTVRGTDHGYLTGVGLLLNAGHEAIDNAAAEQSQPKEQDHAVEEGEQQGDDFPEHSGDAEVGAPAEASGRGGDEGSREESEEVAAPDELADMQAAVREHFDAGDKSSDDLLDALDKFPRKLRNKFVERYGLSPGLHDENADVGKLHEMYQAGTFGAKPSPTPQAEPEPPITAVSPHIALAENLATKLKAGDKIEAKDLWDAANAAYGGTRAEGKYGPSEAYDALEAGFNKSLVGQTNPGADLDGATEQAREIANGVAELPTQTNRSGNKDTFQQFSTPPHYAYAVNWLANLHKGDTVLEPSAGTGCLAVHAANAGADVYTNELDPRRAEFLKDLFGPGKVHIENAEQIAGILPRRGVPAPTAVVMNPPFSQTAGRMGDKKDLMTGAKHIEEALQLLAPNGRLVAIVGRGMGPESPTFRDWFKRIGTEYNIRANVGVEGGEYKKYGTQFATRVLVIDKTGPTGKTATGDVDDIPSLMTKLEEVRNDRPGATRNASGQQGGSDAAEGAGESAGNAPAAVPAELPRASAAGSPAVAELHGGPEDGSVPAAVRAEARASGDDGGGLRAATPGPGRPGGGDAGSAVADAGGTSGPAGRGDQGGRKSKRGRKDAGGKPVQQPAAPLPELRPAKLVEIEAVKPTPTDEPAGAKTEGPPEAKTQADLGASLYESYRPQLLRVKNSQRHPTPLVESAAMAAVRPPTPTYQPTLSPDLVEMKTVTNPDGSKKQLGVSEAALESIVYAGQAHQQFLPAAEGDVGNGKTFVSPDGDAYELQAHSNGKWYLDGGTKWHNFVSQPEAAEFLTKNGWTNADGSPIKPGEVAYRRGYFIGDGTGAGKGREIAGIITDNWNQGRHKHVWVSQKQNLLEDAQRDWKDLGQDPAHLIHFDKIRKSATPPKDGVAFITYDTLKGKPKDPAKPSNLEELVNWLGPDFDGVIAMDEAHGMSNALNTEGGRGIKEASQKALAGIELQKRLPKARVVYVSATGATEVSNLAYAERLGIWGRETPFPDKKAFIAQMDKGGVAAMEAVAQSLKAMGSYTARSLSFDDGTPKGRVTYERLTHQLTDEQRHQYDALADGWQAVLKNIDKALEITGGSDSKNAKSAARSQFWGAQQRFFNQLMTSMQTPSVIRNIEEDLKGDPEKGVEPKAPVIQLVNTMEAATKRAMARRTEDEDLEDLDVSPREVLFQYLEKSFPVHRYETYVDDNGNEQARLVETIVRDTQGNPVMGANGKPLKEPVVDPRAVKLRDDLMAAAKDLKIPESPLDMIINHFGHENVAEVTGRTQRIIRKEDDEGRLKPAIENRNTVQANQAETSAFQDGRKKILVFSDAGGTGRSYHADRGAKNQHQRAHYILQPGWRADNAVQGFGRTHRTNQVSAPTYRLVEIDALKAQRRFISTIARRLDQLGALTRGQRQAGGGGMFKAADNLESKEANIAMEKLFRDLRYGGVEGLNYDDVMKQLGFQTDNEEEKKKRGPRQEPGPDSMGQFLNRLLSLRIDTQGKLFDAFDHRLQETVDQAQREGRLDTGVENYPADKIIKKSDATVYKHPTSGAEVRHIVATAQRKAEKRPWAKTKQGELPLQYVRNKQSGQVWAVYKASDKTDPETGSIVPQYRLDGPTGRQFRPRLDFEGYGHIPFEKIDEDEAQKLWDDEYNAAPDHTSSDEHFITGAFLPIWDRIPGDHPKIFRLRLDDGQTIVGRHIPRKHVETLMKNLGVGYESEANSPSTVHAQLSKGRAKAVLSTGWKLKPVRVQNERRIELTGPSMYHRGELEKDGVISERINYQERYFIPSGPEGVKVLERITKSRPITDVEEAD